MVQRRAARFVCRDYRREAGVFSSLLEKFGWQTLQERREAARLTLFYKIVNKLVAVNTGNLLRASTRNTRSNSALSPAFINIQTTKDCYKYSFFPRTVADWNQLSPRKPHRWTHSKPSYACPQPIVSTSYQPTACSNRARHIP